MENEGREFLNFMLEHPEYYPLLKSEVMLSVLERIAREAASQEQLLTAFKIAKQDLQEVLAVLEKLRLAERLQVKEKTLYYATELAREFLEKCKKGRQEFGFLEKE